LAIGVVVVAGLAVVAQAPGSAAHLAFPNPNPYPTGPGYFLGASDGGVFTFGDAVFKGSAGGAPLVKPVVGLETFPFYEGYWLVASDGGIFSYGSSGFYGSLGNTPLAKPIVGMAAHPSGLGYWLVASDGGVFSYGASKFKGSLGGIPLNKPIVGMAATPSGNGYWLVASDGGIFNYGDAAFFGSTGNVNLTKPVVDMDATPSGNGYWLVASDGGIFNFGGAGFFGSAGGAPLVKPVVGMSRTANGLGYALVATDGGVFTYGNQPFLGSTGNVALTKPVLGIGNRPPLSINVDPFANDSATRSSNWVPGADERLVLTNASATDGSAAGARVLGPEGLNVGQLGNIGFSLETGSTCSPGNVGPHLAVYADTNNDGAFDQTNIIGCAGSGPQTVSASAVTAGTNPLPNNAVVTGVDVRYAGNGTVQLDDITVAGLTAIDHRTVTAAGTFLGRRGAKG